MANTDIEVDNLIINELTKAQFDSAVKSDTELYFVTDEEIQAEAITNQNNTEQAIKTWTGTKEEYDALTKWYGWKRSYDNAAVYTKVPYGTEGDIDVYDSDKQLIPPNEEDANEWYQDKLWYYTEDGNSYDCSRDESKDSGTGKDDSTLYYVNNTGVYIGGDPIANNETGGGGSTSGIGFPDYSRGTNIGNNYVTLEDGWWSCRPPFGNCYVSGVMVGGTGPVFVPVKSGNTLSVNDTSGLAYNTFFPMLK